MTADMTDTSPKNVGDIARRLEIWASVNRQVMPNATDLAEEAAALLRAQAERIRVLESAAPKPDVEKVAMLLAYHGPSASLTLLSGDMAIAKYWWDTATESTREYYRAEARAFLNLMESE